MCLLQNVLQNDIYIYALVKYNNPVNIVSYVMNRIR